MKFIILSIIQPVETRNFDVTYAHKVLLENKPQQPPRDCACERATASKMETSVSML